MKADRDSDKRYYMIALAVLIVAAAAIRIAIATCDIPTLVTKVAPDDSFYYFQIAQNAASGAGITFDGTEPANGFHPLWLALLIPIYYIFDLFGGSGIALPVHLALALEGLLDVGAGLLIYSLVASLTKNRLAGIIGAAVYLLNPTVILHSVNGLETGLNLFCFCLFFRFYLGVTTKGDFTAGEILILGLLSGLLMLARSDNIVIVGITYIHLFFAARLHRRPVITAASVGAASLMQAPWLIWNMLTFGTIMQSSAGAYAIVAQGNLAAAGYTSMDLFLLRASDTLKLLIWTIPNDVFGWGKLLGIAAGLALGMALIDGNRARKVWSAAKAASIPLLATLALMVTHSLVRGTIKSWYLIPAAAVAAIFLGILCGAVTPAAIGRTARGRAAAALAALVILSGYAYNGWNIWQQGMYPWQSEQVMAAEWLRENVDDDAVVGSFNAGIIGYLSEKTVVNLDGLVNSAVVPHLENRTLWDYIVERDIDYLVDSDYSILKDYRDFYGPGWDVRGHLSRIATIDDPAVSWAGSNVAVYRVLPQQ